MGGPTFSSGDDSDDDDDDGNGANSAYSSSGDAAVFNPDDDPLPPRGPTDSRTPPSVFRRWKGSPVFCFFFYPREHGTLRSIRLSRPTTYDPRPVTSPPSPCLSPCPPLFPLVCVLGSDAAAAAGITAHAVVQQPAVEPHPKVNLGALAAWRPNRRRWRPRRTQRRGGRSAATPPNGGGASDTRW